MADLLAMAARYVDSGTDEGPGSTNRVSGELSELMDDVALVESFSHVAAFRTDAGLVLFDASLETLAPRVLDSLRGWTDAPVHTLVYTHGHVDHVGGSALIRDEPRDGGAPELRIIGHENVAARFDRYEQTNGYNAVINTRQFRNTRLQLGDAGRFGPTQWVRPTVTCGEQLETRVGDLEIELHHARGETDDHLWAWIPKYRCICTGDFVTWVFPNAGNPQKVQRYPAEWARALREMVRMEPELLVPAHGLPVGGADRIARVLDDIATALESIVEQCLELMNAGATLDDLVRTVTVADELLAKPYLRPVYDEPEFIVRNVWRLYGGWYDGNPAHLKPAPETDLARALAGLAGGALELAERAQNLAEAGDLRTASHLVEFAALADPESAAVHEHRALIYERRRDEELSLMARAIFDDAARSSRTKTD